MSEPEAARGARSVGRAVLALYGGCSLSARAHVWLRWRSCPLPAVAGALPPDGAILDLGCGHGLLSCLLALGRPGRTVVGIDVDEAKIAVARRAAARARRGGAALRFDVAAPGHVPAGPWSGIAVVDVLYLMPIEEQRRLVLACARALAPGGRLAVKEMATGPRRKRLWNLAQETAAVRVLRLTRGRALAFASPTEVAGWMRAAGLAVESRALDRGYPHPHHLLVGTRAGEKAKDF